MTKEEYAQLHYLLAKLKYSYGELAAQSSHFAKEAREIADKINDILCRCICIIDDNRDHTWINAEDVVLTEKD